MIWYSLKVFELIDGYFSQEVQKSLNSDIKKSNADENYCHEGIEMGNKQIQNGASCIIKSEETKSRSEVQWQQTKLKNKRSSNRSFEN